MFNPTSRALRAAAILAIAATAACESTTGPEETVANGNFAVCDGKVQGVEYLCQEGVLYLLIPPEAGWVTVSTPKTRISLRHEARRWIGVRTTDGEQDFTISGGDYPVAPFRGDSYAPPTKVEFQGELYQELYLKGTALWSPFDALGGEIRVETADEVSYARVYMSGSLFFDVLKMVSPTSSGPIE